MSIGPKKADWINVQLACDPRQVTVQINETEELCAAHDSYLEPFHLRFGSRQSQQGATEVVSRFREVYVSDQPYPWPGNTCAEGPEDVREEDGAFIGYLMKATPEAPRSSEGDIIETKDGQNAIVLQKASTLFCNDIEVRGKPGAAIVA